MIKRSIIIFFILIISFLLFFNKSLLFCYQVHFLSSHKNKAPKISVSLEVGKRKSFYHQGAYSKVWAHRVDRLERYEYLMRSFQGFEVDVVFDADKNYFDVGHPPVASINLSFEKYLQVSGSGNKFFWLDLKNLNNENMSAVTACLKKLDDIYKIKQRIIIESNNPEPLSKISGEGYFTSYYYDDNSYSLLMSSANKESSGLFLKQIDAVSSDILYNEKVKKEFPFKPRLLWALSFENYFCHDLFNELDSDTLLLVYLVNIKSPYHR